MCALNNLFQQGYFHFECNLEKQNNIRNDITSKERNLDGVSMDKKESSEPRTVILDGYDKFGSGERISGALKNMLDYQGVVAPHTGEPFTEALLMGIGGGIGVEYFTWTWKDTGRTQLYFRLWHTKNYSKKNPQSFVRKIASRIGAALTIHETGSREKGYENLIESLNEGKPVLTYLSIWESIKKRPELKKQIEKLKKLTGPLRDDEFIHFLPYYNLPYTWVADYGHCAVVYGIDENTDQVHIADCSTQPLSITSEELAESRAAVPGRKHAAITVDPPAEVSNLKKAVRAGIRDCYQGMLNPTMKNLRVDAFEKWAKLVANQRNKQGWPVLFSREQLFDNFTQVHGLTEFFNTSGGGLRSAYADFLEEASDVISEPELKTVSQLYRELAKKWSNLAQAVLPDSVPLLRDARLAAEKWNNIFKTKGQSLPEELEKAAEKVKSIHQQVMESFPLSDAEVLSLLEDTSKHLHEIHKSEKEALTALKSVVP